MRTLRFPICSIALVLFALSLIPARSHAFYFSTGDTDGRMAMISRPGSPGITENEAADDFVLTSAVSIQHATFTGLLVGGSLANLSDVGVEIYHVFPGDSQNPPDGRVPTRVNSPSDVEYADRFLSSGGLSMAANTISPTFTALNSVQNGGINPLPNQTTGGNGSITGTEVNFDVTFTTPFLLPTDHYFFVPQVAMSNGAFYWLSAPKPILPPGTPFAPDLQAWIRDANLDPDWLRVGTDIVGGSTTYNATFSLDGTAVPAVPEPATASLFGLGLTALFALRGWRGKRRRVPAAL